MTQKIGEVIPYKKESEFWEAIGSILAVAGILGMMIAYLIVLE